MRSTLHASALAAVVLIASACDRVDRLLAIETPSRLGEAQLLVPQNASLIVVSAVADFECAYGGYVVASGLGAGEFVETSQTASRWAYDRRDVLPSDAHYSTFGCEAIGVYTPINTARYTNDQAVRALEGWTDQQVPERQRLIATASAYGGYSLVLLAEGFCAGVIDVGPELTTEKLLDSAEARFTKAITAAQAANAPDLVNLALVGRARARLDRGNKTGAADDAARVPVSFVFNAKADANAGRRSNRVFAQNNAGSVVSVAPFYQNAMVQGRPDPRVRAQDAGRNSSSGGRLWVQQKYASLTAPIPIATGVEAQLILAEARGGAAGIGILNALRARAGVGLPALTPAEEASFQATVFDERRRELWLQGARWFDVRRGNLAQEPVAGTPYAKGGSYGNERCWPLPDVERLANPNLRG